MEDTEIGKKLAETEKSKLLEHHLDDLRRSGLDDATIQAAGIRSATREEGKSILEFDPGCDGYVIPYQPRGSLAGLIRFKPDIPFKGQDGKEAKYLSPKGSANRLYIPHEKLLSMERLQGRREPLYITEGEKKCLKAVQEGLACVAVAGVWSWKYRDNMNDSRTIRDFSTIHIIGREVILVFDSDSQQKYSVKKAAFALGQKIKDLGAESVCLILLPSGEGGEKVGLDDYLLGHTVEDLIKRPRSQIKDPPTLTIDDWLSDDERDNVEEILPKLAALSALEYERVRERVAKVSEIRTSVLDNEVSSLRAKKNQESGSLVTFDEVNPYEAPVNGAALLTEVSFWLSSYVVLPDGAADAIAAWSVASWLREETYFAPVLALLSPAKRSGKTTLLDLLYFIAHKAFLTSGFGVTPAVLFRLNEKEHPTFLIDEAEKLSDDGEARELIGLLNAGYRKGSTVPRCVGDKFEVQSFDAYGFRALAAIGHLWDTILDRSIVVQMKRKKGEAVKRFISREAQKEGTTIAAKISRWVKDNRAAVGALDGKAPRPDWLHDRAADNWSPLFAVGAVAGGSWENKLIDSAKKLQSKAADEADLGEMLLRDIQAIFEKEKTQFIESARIVEALNKIESSPWGDWKGKGYTTIKLASMLRRFEVNPCLLRDGNPVRGYKLEAFSDVFNRYIFSTSPKRDIQVVTSLPPNRDAGFSDYRVVTSDDSVTSLSRYENSPVTSQKLTNAATEAACNNVTSQTGKNEGSGEEEEFVDAD